MITFEEAQRLVLDHTHILCPVEKGIREIDSDVLDENVKAEADLPLFSNSAMDGFALCSDDTLAPPVALRMIGSIKAGDASRKKIGEGEAIKIMTGAPLPEGADAVIMVEDTEEKRREVLVKKSVKRGENVRLRGEAIKKGQIALKKGTKLNPASLGYLVALGRGSVRVFRKPKISLLITGNELVKVGRELKPGKIWESNSTLLTAALSELNIEPIFLGIARDTPQDLEKFIKEGIKLSDILLISGGISVGDYDFVQEILLKLNTKKIFWRVAIKPGKPTFFGTRGKKLVFGLPGNPVSVLVTFLEFVRPAILKMMGQKDVLLPEREAILEKSIQKKPGRAFLLRGLLHEKNRTAYVKSVGMQQSHILDSFARANCLIFLEKGKKIIERGEKVKVQILPW